MNLPYESLMVQDQHVHGVQDPDDSMGMDAPRINYKKGPGMDGEEEHQRQHPLHLNNTSPEHHHPALMSDHEPMSLVVSPPNPSDMLRQSTGGTDLRLGHPPGGSSGQMELLGPSHHLQAMISDQLGGHTGFMSTHPMSQAMWPLSAYMPKVDPYNHHDA
jgi:hypothetical protein